MMIDNIDLVTNRFYKQPNKACEHLLLLIMDSNKEYRQVDYLDSIHYLDTKLRVLYNPKQVRESKQLSLFDIGDDSIDKKRDPDLRYNRKQVLIAIRKWMIDNKHLFL